MVRYWCYRCLCTVVSQLSLFIYYSDCYAGIHVQSLLFTLDTVQSWLHIRYVTTLTLGHYLYGYMVFIVNIIMIVWFLGITVIIVHDLKVQVQMLWCFQLYIDIATGLSYNWLHDS